MQSVLGTRALVEEDCRFMLRVIMTLRFLREELELIWGRTTEVCAIVV